MAAGKHRWTIAVFNRALILFVIVFVLAFGAVALTEAEGRTASVWLANAVLVAIVIRAPRSQWFALIAIGFLANVGGRLANDEALLRATLLSAIVSVESIIVLGLLAKRVGQTSSFDGAPDIRRFLIVAGVIGPLASATLAAAALALTDGAAFLPILSAWYIAHALGFLTLGAMLLAAPSSEAAAPRGTWPGVVVGVLSCGLVSLVVFSQDNAPLLFAVAPALIITALCAPVRGTMAALAACAAIAIGATALGLGPIALADFDPTSRAQVVQGFVAALVMVAIPFRALVGERNRLGDLIARSERLSWRIADAAPSGVIHFDPLGRPMFVNRRWTELTGLNRRAVDRGWLDAIATVDRSAASSLWARARATLEPSTGEFRITKAGKPAGTAELALFPEVENGKVIGFAARLTDVGARRRAEAAEQEREARYRLLTENGQDVILRLGLDGRPLDISGASLRVTGYSPAELLGRPLTKLVHAEDAPLVERSLMRNADGLTDPPIAFRLRHRDGHFSWFESSQRVIFDGHGNPVEIVASLRETEQRRRAEATAATAAGQLRDTHHLLTMVEEVTKVGHWHFDPSDEELDYAPQVDRILGRERSDHLGARAALGIVHPSDRRALLACLARSRRQRGSAECVIRLAARDGLRHVRLVARADQRGDRASGWSGVVADITDTVNADAALVEARAGAQAAAVAKSHFLATMSHDIRTPMTGVLGLIDLLRDDPVPAERDHFFATLKQSADALMAVLDDALGFSAVDSGPVLLSATEFDLEAVAMATLDVFDHAASRKGLLVAFESACEVPPQVRGDAIRLQQILSSLVSTAIRLTDHGQIRLSLRSHMIGAGQSRFGFELKASGIALDPGQIDALFDPVPRLDDSGRSGSAGSGLAISRRLARAMGGDVSICSRQGAGTTFRFDLTLADGLPVEGRRQREAAMLSGARALNVLIAEDNPVNQMLIAAFVRRMGHALTVVENGRRAVAAAAGDHYDVILMDMQMPEMDGLAATRAIRASAGPCAETTIIALTADASPERRRFYDGAGLTDFLTKPIDRAALAARLAAVAPHARRVTAGPPAAVAPAWVEPARIKELRSALGSDRLEALLGLLIAECLNRPALLRTAFCRGDVAAVRAEGHGLKGAALSIGATALGEAAERLEAVASLALAEPLITALEDCALATRLAVQRLLNAPSDDRASA